MNRSLTRLMLACVFALGANPLAHAQGGGFDIGLTKRFPIKNQVNFELRFDLLNVFDNVNFLPHSTAANNSPGAGANIFTTDQSYRDFNNQFDPGGRLGQIVFRLNW